MTPTSARELWSATLGSLQLEVTRHNYETWFKDTAGLEFGGGRLVIGVPSAFVAECLEKRMAPLIHRTVKALAKQDVEVVYQIAQPWAADLATPPAPAALNGPAQAAPPAPRARSACGHLNPRYTFATFVVGKSNRFAHAAAMAVAESPGQAFNPLVLQAGVGLGKTHLLHAIGHAAKAKGLHYLYASAEQFTNDFVGALRDGGLEQFRDKYRTLDVLLIDDIQFIAGKEHSRESFFHTFNDLHTASKQIVITTDTRPKSIPLLEERLSSRLEGGLVADIQPPDLETRMAILWKKAEETRVTLAEPVVDFLARKIVRNVRELEGALNRILAMAQLANRPADLELAAQAVTDMSSGSSRARRVNPQDIIEAVSVYFRVTPGDLTGASRKKAIAQARQVAAYLLREDTERSLSDIGVLLGDRDHTTALRAHDKIAYEVNLNSDLRRDVAEIREAVDRRQARTA